jgi:hypothetical protein
MNPSLPRYVVKVGGSLFDLEGLGDVLRRLLTALGDATILLFPGGGRGVDALRRLDRVHRLGEEASHWLALRALSVNAHFLAQLLPEAVLVTDFETVARWAVVDPFRFAESDEANAGCPHLWSVTSDSLALRLAQVAGADACVLLKSMCLPDGTSWGEAAEKGWVDRHFGAQHAARPMEVRWVNLRDVAAAWRASRHKPDVDAGQTAPGLRRDARQPT